MHKIILLFVFFLTLFLFPANLYAWTMTADFEQGAIGQEAQGPSGLTDAFSQTLYSDENANTGTKSAKVTFTQGSDAWAQSGGSLNYPARVNNGGEIWARFWVYQREPWSNLYYNPGPPTPPGWWKMFRIRRAQSDGTGRGFTSVYGMYEGTPKLDCEVCSIWNMFQNIGTAYALQNNKWECVEMYTKLDTVNGITRMWINGKLKAEYLNVVTNTEATDYADYTYLYSYWNNGVPQNQVSYIDDIEITTDIPLQTDARGNTMIGCGGGADTTPPSAPTGLVVQ